MTRTILPSLIPLADGPLPGVLLADESRHASGSHKEPSARAVVERARTAGHTHVVVGSCGSYGRAMAVACAAAGLRCTVVIPQGWGDGGEFAAAAGAVVHEVPGGYEDAVAESSRLAETTGAADGNVNGPYKDTVLEGHGHVVDALHDALDGEPASLWVPVGNGTTVVAAHRRARDLGWPLAVHGVCSAGNNPVATSWPGPYRPLRGDEVTTTEHNEPLVNWHALHGPDALVSIADSHGAVHSVSDADLVDAQAFLARRGVRASASGAAGLAGLLAHAASTPVAGPQVVLLTGR
ncbi:pyridoxal-phosphate dependent enzyme [Lentzea sp. NPDC058436]|uniref:pyridoxal-phosphate dependent enzyme n=1 Tax=Lentzea sp. NPDC058436 TaxID=3346499 RepID=UPI00365FD8C1